MSDVFDDLLVGSAQTVKPQPIYLLKLINLLKLLNLANQVRKRQNPKKSKKSSSKSKKRLRGGSFSTVKTHYDS